MSLEKPRSALADWGFSLCSLVTGIDALGVQIGVQVGAVIANAPPNTDERRTTIAVPPLCEFFDAAKQPHFCVFGEEDTVVIKDICHLKTLSGCSRWP